jgi:hypothetical protein
MVLFDEPHLKIEFKNVPCKHLVATWTGCLENQQFKDGIQTVLRCCHENDIRKIISDTRRQDRVHTQDKKYADHAIKEYTTRHGVFFQAVIVSSDTFLEFSVENFDRQSRAKQQLNQYFSNDKEAINWLTEIDL